MTQQEFDDLIEQLEAELEEAKANLRDYEEENNLRMIYLTQDDISRIVHKISSAKHDWKIQNG